MSREASVDLHDASFAQLMCSHDNRVDNDIRKQHAIWSLHEMADSD